MRLTIIPPAGLAPKVPEYKEAPEAVMTERMTTLAEHAPTLELLRQEYIAAPSDLYSDQNLTPDARQSRIDEPANEYRHRRGQEIKAVTEYRDADVAQ